MVAGPAVDDAVRRARAMPNLHVGLHLVVIEGPAVTPPDFIKGLVNAEGYFPSDQTRLGFRYYFSLEARRQLRVEIAAQFDAFAATGLRLDHANCHKHMHLHPTIGRLLIEEGQRHGLPAIRVPAEPPNTMALVGQTTNVGSRMLFGWTQLLRSQANRSGIRTNDHVFGLRWTGHMTADRLLQLAPVLPAGLTEIYFHPATESDALLRSLMPQYEHEAELKALLDPAVSAAFPNRTTYS